MAFFKRLFQKITLVEELQNILNEEELLLKAWYKEWAKLTQVLEQKRAHMGYNLIRKENVFLKSLWENLVRLNRESQKVNELWKLAMKGEEKLPENKRKVLRQLRSNLDWEGFEKKLKTETSDYGEYKKIVKQLIGNEVEFWKHLNEEKDEIKTRIQEETISIRQIKKTAEMFISKIDSNDPNWARGYDTLFDKKSFQTHIYKTMDPMKELVGEHEEDFLEFMEEEKEEQKGLLEDAVSKCGHILNFFKRANDLLKEINKQLKAARPRSRGPPYRSVA